MSDWLNASFTEVVYRVTVNLHFIYLSRTWTQKVVKFHFYQTLICSLKNYETAYILYVPVYEVIADLQLEELRDRIYIICTGIRSHS